MVQSRVTEERVERERNNFSGAIGGQAALDYISAVDEKLAWTSPKELLAGYDGVIFGGSSDFDFNGGRPDKDPIRLMSTIILSRARNIVAYALEKEMPVLGVCFGHQIIGEMHEGYINNDTKQAKAGSFEVSLSDKGHTDPLFSLLPKTFVAQYEHKDSLTRLPKGATLLATGAACRFSALRYGSKAYTVQFHPEMQSIPGGLNKESPEAYGLVRSWVQAVVPVS